MTPEFDTPIPFNRRHEKMLVEHGRMLVEHGRMLGEHGRMLDEHGKLLGEHGKKLDEHDKKLDEHGQKIDANTRETHRLGILMEDFKTDLRLVLDAVLENQRILKRLKPLEEKVEGHELRLSAVEHTIRDRNQ